MKDTDILLYLFLSQLYAIPVGIFVKLPSSRLIEKYDMLIGWVVGILSGILIFEILAFASCALIVFVPLLRSRLKWKKVYADLQRREGKIK